MCILLSSVGLKCFVRNTGLNGNMSDICCQYRDLAALREFTKVKRIKVITTE